MTHNELLVEGEPARLLLEALQTLIADSDEHDGMIHFEGLIGGDAGAALVHALGRVTAAQRGADAFLLLMERVAGAFEAEGATTPARYL